MQLQSWNSVDSSLYCAMKQNRTEKQLMHASHSHNYYFIKELLPLAGILWHCWLAQHRKEGGGCGFRGGGRGMWEGRGVMGGEETCFNLGHLPVCTGSGDRASSAPHLKTHMLYWVSTWINCPNYSWYKKKGELKMEKHLKNIRPQNTSCSGMLASRKMGTTCQDDGVTVNCFKRGNVHPLCWRVAWLLGEVGSSLLPHTHTHVLWGRQTPWV